MGAFYLTMREGMSEEYIAVPLNTSLKGWKEKWFYIGNVSVHEKMVELPEDIDAAVQPNPNWTARLDNNGMNQVEELVRILAQIDIDGVEVAKNFIGRRIHPCKLRQRPAYEYHPGDFEREAPEPVTNVDIDECIGKLFALKKSMLQEARERHPPKAYYIIYPPPPVSFRYSCS